MGYLIISDIPTPWREPVFERVYDRLGGAVQTVYFKDNEKRRLWTFQRGHHPKTVLRAITLTSGGTERFLNPGLLPLLVRRRPRAALVMACIKDPSGWLAMGLCRLLGVKAALLDDSWIGREQGVGRLRRLARWIVYNGFGDAYVGASKQTLALHKHYNPRIRDEQCFLSHLVADNDHFNRRLAGRDLKRSYDVMFSGRIVSVKNPAFFAQVCAAIKARLGRCRVLIIGEGEPALKAGMCDIFDRAGVSYEFAGFIRHEELPDYYVQARLLLLPTSGDCWGVVLNEAMVAGTPVMTTEWTAAAGELVIHEKNGYILPLDVDRWANAAAQLRSDGDMWERFSAAARTTVADFNYDNAAQGILDAFAYLEGKNTVTANACRTPP